MRSWLFVPGDDEKKLVKGWASHADALIIDLEDSVASSRKEAARAIATVFILSCNQAPRSDGSKSPALFVRINALATPEAVMDLDAVMKSAPAGIVLPKAAGGADIQQLGVKLAVREAENNLADGSTPIIAIATETARSLFHMGSYQGASARLQGLAWGGEDLSADIGAETNKTPEGHYADPYRLARTLTLLGSAAAGVEAIDSVFTDFRDNAGLQHEATLARRDGFSGKMAIHPAQVEVINAVFTPTIEAIEHARAIVAAFTANPDAGVIGLNGKMIDLPHLRQAKRILARIK